MNKLSKKQALSNLLLLGTLLAAPGVALADEMTAQAVREADSHITGAVNDTRGSVEGVKSEVSKANDVLNKILDKHDISSKEMVTALINYAAKASINKYALDEQKFFQVAPGSLFAARAADKASKIDTTRDATQIAVLSLINSLGMLSTAETITVLGITISVKEKPAMGALQFYDAMRKFFESGDSNALKNVNAAALMQSTVLTGDDINDSTKDRPSQTLVNVLTNPFPVRDNDLRNKLKNGVNLSGAEMERLGMIIAQYALVGVSSNAWADIVARRTPPVDSSGKAVPDGLTMMQLMEQGSKDRFTNKDWYASIGASSETALLREIAHMMAYNQWVQYQQFRLIEQQVSLLASINGVMAKINTSIDTMTIEMRKAQEEAKIQAKKAEEQAAQAKIDAQEQADEAAKNAQ